MVPMGPRLQDPDLNGTRATQTQGQRCQTAGKGAQGPGALSSVPEQ